MKNKKEKYICKDILWLRSGIAPCLLFIFTILGSFYVQAQQDPQYTQYMYNTQVVNPAYIGTKEALNFGLLYRTQWLGFDGAPKTGTFSASAPIGAEGNMGLGASIIREELGPSTETSFSVDYSYAIPTSDKAQVSFGIKGGVDLLDVDFSKLDLFDPTDPRFLNNIDNRFQPRIGAGVYYYSDKFYAGLSVPNVLTTKHFDASSIDNTTIQPIAAERLHYYFISGYVFNLSDNLKFKPATLVKLVSGSPLQVDASANFLLYEKFTLGASYRWSAAVSALVGFHASNSIFIGFGYDYETTDIQSFNDGTYELFLTFDISSRPRRQLSPRFF